MGTYRRFCHDQRTACSVLPGSNREKPNRKYVTPGVARCRWLKFTRKGLVVADALRRRTNFACPRCKNTLREVTRVPSPASTKRAGILHHTGAMWRAVEHVTTFVRSGGLLAIANYRKSPACAFWQREKKFYSSAPPPVRLLRRSLYKTAHLSAIPVVDAQPEAFPPYS
jgi:hypothetical protein